jgi:hypothetical protein
MITRGINLAERSSTDYNNRYKKCVFLSHRSVDKDKVIKLGEYIKRAGFNIYLDINDVELQSASVQQNSEKITECIQKGIIKSDYILCCLSKDTFDDTSWWVPYEIGFSDNAKKECCLLKLESCDKKDIPDYLLIKEIIYQIPELNKKLKEWSDVLLNETMIKSDYNDKNGLLHENLRSSHNLYGVVDLY